MTARGGSAVLVDLTLHIEDIIRRGADCVREHSAMAFDLFERICSVFVCTLCLGCLCCGTDVA